MEIRRLTSDEGLPVSLEDLKLDLRVDDGDEDETLRRMAQAAAGLIERRSGYVLIPGTFEALADAFADWQFQRAPFRSLDKIEALTAKNTWTEQELDDFRVLERERGFEICAYSSFTAPCLYECRAGIRITFSAGFDVEPESGVESSGDGYPIDPTVRGVFIALVAHFYENRELFAADKLTEIESTAGGLLSSIRTFW